MDRLSPRLGGVREELRNDGKYTLVLEFDTRKEMTLEMWTERQGKLQSFFGPGIVAEVEERGPVRLPRDLEAWKSSSISIWDYEYRR